VRRDLTDTLPIPSTDNQQIEALKRQLEQQQGGSATQGAQGGVQQADRVARPSKYAYGPPNDGGA
jgi:hypothetical protein